MGWGGSGRLFEFDWEGGGLGVVAYSRWALIPGWAHIRINAVTRKSLSHFSPVTSESDPFTS